MAVAHVQTIKTVHNLGITTHTISAQTYTAGSLVVVGIIAYNGGTPPNPSSVVMSGGGTFTRDRTLAAGAGVNATIFSYPNVSAGSQTITATYPDSTILYWTGWAMEISGAATSAPQDGAGASASGSSSAAASGSFSGQATSFYVGLVDLDTGANPATLTAGSGWTIPTNGSETDGSNNLAGAIEYKANPGSTSHNADFTVTSAPWIALGMAYLVAGGGGGAGFMAAPFRPQSQAVNRASTF